MKRDMNELVRMARGITGTHAEDAIAAKPMTISRIDEQLGGQLGRPNLGFFGNIQANKHARQAQLESWKKIVSEKYDQLGALAVDALKAEAALIRERLRIEWNHQFSVLAERAAVCEMSVSRKLEAVLEAGRELVYGDRFDAVEKLQERHAAGQLSDDDLRRELRHLFDRCERLLDEFMQIVDERRNGVRTAFRGNNNLTGA